MSKNKDISRIKESFESQSFNAPNDLWSKIESGIENQALDAKVKESFENISMKAPAFDYETLSNAPNKIDEWVKGSFEQTLVGAPENVWEGIQNGMQVDAVWNAIQSKIRVRSNKWQVLAVAASVAFLFAVIPFKTFDTRLVDIEFPESLLGEQANTENSLIIEDSNVLLANALETDLVDNNSGMQSTRIDEPYSTVKESNQSDDDQKSELDYLSTSSIEKIPSNLISPSHSLSPAHDIIIPTKESKWSFNAGIIAGVSNTWLLDNDTRASLNNESLLDSKFSIGEMYGITAEAKLNNKHSFSTNILLNDVKRSKLGYYENGFYKHRKTKIEFFKASVLYGYQVNLNTSKFGQALLFKAGPYVGVNKASYVVNEDVMTSFNSSYKKVDVGLNMQIGHEINVSRFIVGYGLNTEVGMRNIFDGNAFVPSKLNYTNNISAGLYFSLKYKL